MRTGFIAALILGAVFLLGAAARADDLVAAAPSPAASATPFSVDPNETSDPSAILVIPDTAATPDEAPSVAPIPSMAPIALPTLVPNLGNEHVRSRNRVFLIQIPALTLVDTIETRYFVTHKGYCPPRDLEYLMGGPIAPPNALCSWGEADPIARYVVYTRWKAYTAWLVGNAVMNGVVLGLDEIPLVRRSNALNIIGRIGLTGEGLNDLRNTIPVSAGIALQLKTP
jgi:hypothetical protein